MARPLHIYMKFEVFPSSSMEYRIVIRTCFYVLPGLTLSIITSLYSLHIYWEFSSSSWRSKTGLVLCSKFVPLLTNSRESAKCEFG